MHSAQGPVTAPAPSKRKLFLLLCGVSVGAAFLAYSGITGRAKGMQETAAWTEAQSIPTVSVVQAKRGPQSEDLTLPGSLAAMSSAPLYARASGYVSAWNKDIGARVRKGDVLAEISAPDLDQQLAEARATLLQLEAAVQQAQANSDMSEATNRRTSRLVQQGWSSEERGDTDRFTAASRTAALSVAKANLVVQQAVVGRLEELSRFKQIRAPFDGIVTARTINVGDLLTAGGTAGRPLFRISDISRMRIYVDVPQAFLAAMKPGLKATLSVPGHEKSFTAEVTSTANAVSEESRKGLVELQADNPNGDLWPGAFTQVQFHIPSNPDTLRIPVTALMFNRNGTFVAEVQANKVELKPVNLGRNLGNDVEVRSGVMLSSRLIDNPQEFITTGDTVHVAGEPLAQHTASAN
ncbi:efflux RND transporter periplasmic adaptor subunit [Methylobacterium gnaphalii]|uniref:RND transporter MFP subunit n=1 Tax=Methylobacterium gnaphalii TaxID=1010610 RepID=A0A512JLL1_9HYPH|nr:efflux RND transporter periplasmic adaptor subunit [Methylobacterium gnaphalii]GEP10849.1 RND transporter MFP subunit [Methylobacterium gnaphalii]GJD70773.1 Multidrug resistance protein MdtA [Methylobacterium gnaphalii]GLS50705.1 RND transporter MFP subunit [Methylobacterium gnaphalii]